MRRLVLCLALALLALSTRAQAEIVFIGSSTAASGASGSSTLVIAPPAGTAVGQLLIAQVAHRGGASVTVSSPGWQATSGTARVDTSADNLSSLLMYKFAGTSEPASYTFTLSSSQRSAVGILAYAGVDPTNPFEAVNGQANNSASTSAAAPAVPVSTTNSYVAWFWSGARDGLTITPPAASSPPVLPSAPAAGFQVADGGGGPNGVTLRSADARPGDTGSTGTQTATLSNSVRSTGQTVLLRGLDVIGMDHYSVTHSTTAVNCQAENVTVVAHDSSHVPGTVTSTTQIGLLAARVSGPAAGNVGDWTLISGGGTLANGTVNDGQATYTFAAGGESSVVFGLKVTPPNQVVNVSVSDGSATDTSGTASADAGYNQDLTFVPAGFRISNAGGSASAIGTQIAGKNSDSGFGAQSLALQAIRTDTSTGACVAAFPTGTEVVIEAANQCNTPATCSARQVTLTTQASSNNSAAIANNNGPGAPSSYTSGLRFRFAGANAEAPFRLNYPEAGQIRLYFRYNLPLGDGSASGNYMSGSSAPFVVRPFGFYTTATGNPGTTTPTGAVFIRAGLAFAGNVRAVVYAAGQDANNDGVPDSCAALAGNSATPNFSVTTTVSASAPYEPASGTLGALTHGALSWSGGNAPVADFRYGEVGSFSPRTEASNYISAGVNVTTTCGAVGRFIPDHFMVANSTPQFRTGCTSGGFTYLQQPFGYSAGNAPVITATARNALGSTTQNYAGSFFRLSNASVAGRSYTAASGTLDLSGLPPTASDPLIASSGGGVGTLTFGSGSGLSFARTALAGPFDAEIRLAVDVIDLDGVTAASNPVTFGAASAGNGIAFSAGKQLRFGRALLTSAHGSELLPLVVPLRAEYWTGSGFALNAADSCTAVPVGELALAPSPPPLSTTPTLTSPLAAGDAGLALSAPGSPGYFDLLFDLSNATGASVPWLRYDWAFDGNSDGAFDDDPQARATFGIYAGDEPLVYVREVY